MLDQRKAKIFKWSSLVVRTVLLFFLNDSGMIQTFTAGPSLNRRPLTSVFSPPRSHASVRSPSCASVRSPPTASVRRPAPLPQAAAWFIGHTLQQRYLPSGFRPITRREPGLLGPKVRGQIRAVGRGWHWASFCSLHPTQSPSSSSSHHHQVIIFQLHTSFSLLSTSIFLIYIYATMLICVWSVKYICSCDSSSLPLWWAGASAPWLDPSCDRNNKNLNSS